VTPGCARVARRAFLRLLRTGAALVAVGCVAAGCRTPEPAAEPAPAPRPLAEGTTDAPRVLVQLMSVERTAAEVVTVQFVLVNPDPSAPVRVGQLFGVEPADGDGLAGVHLVDGDRKKYFVLRDDQGKPECTSGLGAIPPGGQVTAWIRFPAPPAEVSRITVQVPNLAPFGEVVIAQGGRGTAPTKGAY